jgi:hypothetical protein
MHPTEYSRPMGAKRKAHECPESLGRLIFYVGCIFSACTFAGFIKTLSDGGDEGQSKLPLLDIRVAWST